MSRILLNCCLQRDTLTNLPPDSCWMQSQASDIVDSRFKTTNDQPVRFPLL